MIDKLTNRSFRDQVSVMTEECMDVAQGADIILRQYPDHMSTDINQALQELLEATSRFVETAKTKSVTARDEEAEHENQINSAMDEARENLEEMDSDDVEETLNGMRDRLAQEVRKSGEVPPMEELLKQQMSNE